MNNAMHANPYVGARTFETKEKDLFFGREREALDLLSLVISERLVLFYAQSGAGKSSLINTRLIPGLIEQEEYKVIPVGRLLGESNQGNESNNIYTYNLITSLIKQKLNETLVSKLTLSEFLAGLDHDDKVGYFYNETLSQQSTESDDDAAWKYVLIIDQFEELFTTHQEEWSKREDFFKQLAQAMDDFPNLWIVLVMREDYIAMLDPYAHLLPGKFRGRYYMQRLGHHAAIEAVQGPAAKLKRPFANGVAEKLVNDLSSIKVRKPDNTLDTQAGQYVEPVQLQVVCSSLWGKLPDVTQITQEDLDKYVGDVNQALGNYYEERVKAVAEGEVAERNGVKERDIREWFGRKLITADGIRNMVAQERDGDSGGLNDDVVQEFVKRGDLVRAEKRGGATFYELTHDRLVEPILENNKEWFNSNSSLVQQQTALWIQQGRSNGLLLQGRALRKAGKEAESLELTKDERAFLEASWRSERNRTILWITTGIVLIAMMVLSLTAFRQSRLAIENARIAEMNLMLAERQQAIAIDNEKIAKQNAQEALDARQAAEVAQRIAEAQRSAARAQIYQSRPGGLYTSTLLAIDSFSWIQSDEVEEILRKNINLLPLAVNRLTQSGAISSVEFSPDGLTFVAASLDGTACVWNVQAGTQLFCATSLGSVNDAAFSPDGQFIVTGDEAGHVMIMDAKTGGIRGEFEYDAPVRDVNIKSDGKLLAAVRQNGKITIIDLVNLRESYYLETSHSLNVAAFSPDGVWVAIGSSEGFIVLWNLENERIISSFKHKGEVLTLVFSPDSSLLLSGGRDSVVIITNPRTGTDLERISLEDQVEDIAFHPGGSWFVTASADKRLRVWDTQSGAEKWRKLQDGFIHEVEVGPSGQWIATTGSDRTVRVWSASTGAEIFQIPLRGSGSVLAFSSDSNYLVSGDAGGELNIWDISTMLVPENYIEFDGLITNTKSSPTGEWISVSDENRVWLLDQEQPSVLTGSPEGQPLLEFKSAVKEIIVSPDSKVLGIATDDNEIGLYQIEDRSLKMIRDASLVQALAFSPDSMQLVTADADGNVRLWDANTAEFIRNFIDVDSSILSMTTSAEFLALGLSDKILLLDWNSGQVPIEIETLGDNQLLAFSADASLFASSSSIGQIEIWKQENGEFSRLNIISVELVYSLTINPAGNLIAVGTANNVYLVDSNTGEESARIPHPDTVNDVSFSPDGHTLVTASSRILQFWDISQIQALKTEDLIETACSRLPENLSHAQWRAIFGNQEYRVLCETLPVP